MGGLDWIGKWMQIPSNFAGRKSAGILVQKWVNEPASVLTQKAHKK